MPSSHLRNQEPPLSFHSHPEMFLLKTKFAQAHQINSGTEKFEALTEWKHQQKQRGQKLNSLFSVIIWFQLQKSIHNFVLYLHDWIY